MLQIQLTILQSDSYLGLRVNLADFMLPFVGVFILVSLYKKKTKLPIWQKPFAHWCPILLCGVIILSLFTSLVFHGQVSNWALYNKSIGWIILMAYLAMGGWVTTNFNCKFIYGFFFGFIGMFFLIVMYEALTDFIFWELGSKKFGWPGKEISGAMDNRNAFAFLALIAFIIFIVTTLTHVSLYVEKHSNKCKNIIVITSNIFCLFIPIILLLNGSRAFWLSFILAAIMLTFRYRARLVKFTVFGLVIGSLLAPMIYDKSIWRAFSPIAAIKATLSSDGEIYSEINNQKYDNSYDLPRIETLSNALKLNQTYLFTGTGLGGVLKSQSAEHEQVVLDNTPLWIFTEMGPLGFFAFIWVFLIMLQTLYRKPDEMIGIHDALRLSAFYMLLMFGVFSLFHEILYTRVMWFILGIALALPKSSTRLLNQ